MEKNHYQENFRRSGFVNDGFHAWPPVKRRNSENDDANQNKSLLSGKNLIIRKSSIYMLDLFLSLYL